MKMRVYVTITGSVDVESDDEAFAEERATNQVEDALASKVSSWELDGTDANVIEEIEE